MRSPLKDRALRNPGEGLVEKINRLQTEDTGPYLMVGVMFVFVAVLEWARFSLKWPPQPWLFTGIAILVCCLAGIKVMQIKKSIRNLKQGQEGEKAVGQYLERLREKGYRVFHDIAGGKFNLDHVLIGSTGIYMIETKTISKPNGREAVVEYDGEKVTVAGFSPDRNPVAQAKELSRWLKDLIKESTGKSFGVRPVVLYPGWFVNEQPKGAKVWVLNPKALPGFLEHESETMSPDDVHLVSYHLSRYVRGTRPFGGDFISDK
ncbi:MAG: nuclease-related domain-containing protein [Deltaproteobacteria bacterium]